MHERVHCRDEPANHQLPVAVAIFAVFIAEPTENIEVQHFSLIVWPGGACL